MFSNAAILTRIGKPLEIKKLRIPALKEGQVLVKILYSGICHSQLNEIYGLKGKDKFLPHTLGHEGSGVVEDIGKGVKKVNTGDHVVLTWIKGKGLDVPNTTYLSKDTDLVINSGAISTFMDRAVISENRIVKIPSEISMQVASLLGCAIPTGMGIIQKSLKPPDGSKIAIFGVGGIGLSSLMASKLSNASSVIAVDISKYKLQLAKRLGATHIINAKHKDPVSEIIRISEGTGTDYTIEAAGVKEAMENAFKAVRCNGGICVLAGNLAHNQTISLNPFELIQGKRIIGTWGGETDPDYDIPQYAEQILSGKLKLDDMITHVFPLEGLSQALNLLKNGNAGRIILEM